MGWWAPVAIETRLFPTPSAVPLKLYNSREVLCCGGREVGQSFQGQVFPGMRVERLTVDTVQPD